jgi:hypothetical protein
MTRDARPGDKKISAKEYNQLRGLLRPGANANTPQLDDLDDDALDGTTLPAMTDADLLSFQLSRIAGPETTDEDTLLFDFVAKLTQFIPTDDEPNNHNAALYAHTGYKKKTGDLTRAAAANIFPARVKLNHESHAYCDPTEDSGIIYNSVHDGAHRIVWKAETTGESVLCLIALGTPAARTLWGKAKYNWQKQAGGDNDFPSHAGKSITSSLIKPGFVVVNLWDYRTKTFIDEETKVLLPSGWNHDPNVIEGQVIQVKRIPANAPNFTCYNGGSITGGTDEFLYSADGDDYLDAMIGTVIDICANNTNVFVPPPGWKLQDGSQDTATTLSGLAVDASNKYPKYQGHAHENSTTDPTIDITAVDVAGLIQDHTDHLHEPAGTNFGTEGPFTYTTHTPGYDAGFLPGVGDEFKKHKPITGEGATLSIDLPDQPYQRYLRIERIDNSYTPAP